VANIQSMQIDGTNATTAWQTLYDILTFTIAGVAWPALPLKVRELAIQNRDATANLYVTTSRPDGSAPGVTSGDFLRAEKVPPGGGYDLTRGSQRSINTKEILVACNPNAPDSASTCAFVAKTTGM